MNCSSYTFGMLWFHQPKSILVKMRFDDPSLKAKQYTLTENRSLILHTTICCLLPNPHVIFVENNLEHGTKLTKQNSVTELPYLCLLATWRRMMALP